MEAGSTMHTILYTYNLRGDLAILPRLHTFVQTLKRDLPQSVYLIDLGRSCVPDVWPCDVTQGRSTLLVLDAMGYSVAQVTDVLTPASRAKLTEQVMVALVDDDHPHVTDTIRFLSHPPDERDDKLTVVMTPAVNTRFDGHILTLSPVEKGQIGLVRTEGEQLIHEVYTLPENTRIDATIQGAVDFITSEARFFEKKRGNHNGDYR